MSPFLDSRFASGPPSLPSIRALVDVPGFSCRHCGSTFVRAEHRDHHLEICLAEVSRPSSGRTAADHVPSAGLDAQHPAWMASIESGSHGSVADISSAMQSTSPPQRYGSDDSGTYFTPTLRRRSSASATDGRARNYDFAIYAPHTASRARTPTLSQKDKREHKKQKEKLSRQQMSLILQCSEDMHQNYFDLKPCNLQTAGNGNEAGLELVKIDNHMGNLCLLNHFIHRDYLQALRDDRLDAWRASMCDIVNSWRAHPTLLTKGTWLHDGSDHAYEACEHRRRDKACIKHRHPDHRRCRKDRHRNNFDRNLEAWNRENGRSPSSNMRSRL